MRNYILGILTVLLAQTAINYAYLYSIDNGHKSASLTSLHILENLKGSSILDVLTERCTNDQSRNGTRREWFKCNAVQIFFSDLLFGEIKKEYGDE